MNKRYFDKVTGLLKWVHPKLDTVHTVEFKNCFGAVAGYVNGHIFISCGKFGVALRLPPESLDTLFLEKDVKHLKYFSKGHIKKEYAILPKRILDDKKEWKRLLSESLQYARLQKHMSLPLLKKALRSYASAERKKTNEWFFKTGKGQYGYGDIFMGVSDPDSRTVARQFEHLQLSEVKKLLQSKIHEERATALKILVRKFEVGDERVQKQVYDFYLKNLKQVNNWDLVDASAYKIAGAYIHEHPKQALILDTYARSRNLWERRLSIIATLSFIRNNEFEWTMKNAKVLLTDSHDLTHKAVGWMLREVWKRDHKIVEDFLTRNYGRVPRTTLRYAIEKMKEGKRKRFLKGF